jgi:adhesin HecA-like repeat protein
VACGDRYAAELVAAGAEQSGLEQRVRTAVGQGEPVDCAPRGTTPDDLDAIDDWDQRVITAELLAELCTRQGACDSRVGVRLRGAHITGTVDLAHADVRVPLRLEVCRFDEGVDLTEAHVRSLRVMRCAIPTLGADELESDHSLYFNHSRLGDLVLVDARIRGGLSLTGATLTNDNGTAFNGDRLSVTGGAFFSQATVTGELRLSRAQIGGPLDLTGATLTNDNGTAFNGDGLSVTGGAFFRQATVTGELRLLGAQIGGQLDLTGATLTNDNGKAFSGDSLSLTGGAFFRQATVTGELRLPGAQISGQLNLTGATLTNDNGTAFNGQEMRAATWFFRTRSGIEGDVDLTGADVANLVDRLSTWPERVFLDGFTYGALTGAEDGDVASRLAWIRRNHDFSPGVYDQLADVYRRAGQDQDAREVTIARENDRRHRGQLSLPSKTWNMFLSLTVAHGYKPWRAALFLVVVVAMSTWLFLKPEAQTAMAPTKSSQPVPSAADCTASYECFEPWIYSLDVVIPVVDLHQDNNWVPSADRPWGEWYRALTWALIAIGWLLTTAVLAAISTLWRR